MRVSACEIVGSSEEMRDLLAGEGEQEAGNTALRVLFDQSITGKLRGKARLDSTADWL